MPTPIIKKYAELYDVPIKTVQKEWDDSYDIASGHYGKPYKKPKVKKSKTKNSYVYGTTTNIFKNKMKKKYDTKENIITLFEEFNREEDDEMVALMKRADEFQKKTKEYHSKKPERDRLKAEQEKSQELIKANKLIRYWKNGDIRNVFYEIGYKNTELGHKMNKVIDNVDVNKKDNSENGRTGLILSMHLNCYHIFKKLLERGADISIKDDYGDAAINTKLHDEYWEKEEIQDLVLKYQPENYKLLSDKVEIHPNIKKKYEYLFDSEELGLL